TPDLRGTQGTFSWFSTGGERLDCEGGVRLPLVETGGVLRGSLPGPEQTSVEFAITRGSDEQTRKLEIQGERYTLRTGEYTPWIRLRFARGLLSSTRGIVRFLLTETAPDVSLYVTPVEIDPER